jgi:hypothetical protein
MFLFRRNWRKIYTHEVITHMRGLNLEIVGGLNYRGWTIHDIDVIGDVNDVPIFIERLEKAGIKNPVHLCDLKLHKHSHILCLVDGLKVILFENTQFRKPILHRG